MLTIYHKFNLLCLQLSQIMAVANNQTQYDDESKSDKIVKEPSPVAPTSDRASAVQLTIGPKIPSQENLVSLGHKEDLSLPDNPFST